MAAATAIAVAAVSTGERVQLALCGVVATIAMVLVVAEALRRGRALTLLRSRAEVLESRVAHQEAETARLGHVLLPEAVARIQQGDFIEDVLKDVVSAGADGYQQLQDAQLAVLRSVLVAVAAEEDLRESAQRTFVNIARRVQAIVHQQAQDLQEMEHRHGRNLEVFDDLLHLDHGFARVGRLADSMAVLGGARPGRQWNNAVSLYSVLRGAMSRILDYQRVELHSVTEVAVVGPAVEPLIHALAELLDNATLYSPPQTRVHLTAVEVQAGIAVEIEDGGLGLTEEGRARAERMLQEAQAGIDLNDLGETPRLGLAVVGRLARTYNFQVSLRPSAYRGVRAVLIIPQNLITATPVGSRIPGSGRISGSGASLGRQASGLQPSGLQTSGKGVPLSRAPESPVVPQLWSAVDGEITAVTERTSGGLPQRRRNSPTTVSQGGAGGAGGAGGSGGAAKPDPQVTAAEAVVQPGMWLSAFQEAVGSKAPGTAPSARISDESSDEVE